MKLAKYLLLGSIFFLSCEKKGVTDISNECDFSGDLFNNCFFGSAYAEYDGIVFRDDASFQRFSDSLWIYPINISCDTAQINSIDFDKYSLLTIKTTGGGCSVDFNRKVLKDTEDKKIVYEIKVRYKGECSMLILSRNWAIIPKVPNDYLVEFIVK